MRRKGKGLYQINHLTYLYFEDPLLFGRLLSPFYEKAINALIFKGITYGYSK